MSEPIRVLLHVDALSTGGLERQVTELAVRLDRSRFAPVVSWSLEWGEMGERLRAAGIPVVQIAPHRASHPEAEEAVRRIREIAPDIFHTFSCRQHAYDTLAAHEAGVGCIVSARDNERHWTPDTPARNWQFDRNAKTHYVTPGCEAAAELCRRLEGMRAERVVTIHDGVETPEEEAGPTVREELGLGAGTVVIGYAAGYRKRNGHENLLRAVRLVAERGGDVHLVCQGADEDGRREKLAGTAELLGLRERVTLLGPRDRMNGFYRGLDFYVHASAAEALPRAILAAMSHGLAVAAPAAGGVAEAVTDGETGLLAERGNAEGLAAAIERLAGDPAMRRAMGAAGKRRAAERFSIGRMVMAHEDLYERAMAGKGERTAAEAIAFTGGAGARELADTTVFVTTVGDVANYEDCLAHLRGQTVRCAVEVLDRVAPMSAAFAQMHERCGTAYYVQVDEDMLLRPDAIERLRNEIAAAPERVAMVCRPLWDCDVEHAIRGVKIYRHAIVRQFPYQNVMSCDVDQLRAMEAAGYETVIHSPEAKAECLGEHGKHYTPETIFRRWQRLFHKRTEIGTLDWLDPWPERLLARYVETRDPIHFYALLGAVAGIGGRPERGGELDWRDANPALQRMHYYFGKYREGSD